MTLTSSAPTELVVKETPSRPGAGLTVAERMAVPERSTVTVSPVGSGTVKVEGTAGRPVVSWPGGPAACAAVTGMSVAATRPAAATMDLTCMKGTPKVH